MLRPALLLMLVSLALPASAEVYKWTDENGKVHFTDKPPTDKPAENIDATLKDTNIDTSSKDVAASLPTSTEKTQDEIAHEQQKAEERKAELAPVCSNIKRNIDMLEAGARVNFYDSEGNEYTVLEKDRPAKIAEWKNTYAELGCE